jgi:2-iminobutanoate/2-iminopropanoate deaminase
MSKPHNSPGFRAGNWLVVSGQTGRVGESLVEGGFAPQFRQALANVKRVVTEGGYALTDVAKVTIFLANMADYARMNDIYAEFFEGHLPARTTVGVNALNRNAAVEVEAWAFRA